MIKENIDVFCVGQASYDLTFRINHQPMADEKMTAAQMFQCGGGPAANAAFTVASLGGTSVFAGYLGNDYFGDLHFEEFKKAGVQTKFITRNRIPTALSVIFSKPDGNRSVVNYKDSNHFLKFKDFDFQNVKLGIFLFDGHEPELSNYLIEHAKKYKIPSILDAGSVHKGTSLLIDQVDYIIASEKFALEYSGKDSVEKAIINIGDSAIATVITLGEKGLIWKKGTKQGMLDARKVKVVDTTGAGDVFHGAFALGIVRKMEWKTLLQFANTAAATCCTAVGGRSAISDRKNIAKILAEFG